METPPQDRATVPYHPSWVDRLTAWVDRLPGPTPFYYLAAAFMLTMTVASSQWAAGVPFPTIRLFYIFFGALAPYALGLIHALDHRAVEALERFQPILLADEDERRTMAYRLSTLPAGPALIATLLGLVAGLAFALLIPLEESVLHVGLVISPWSGWVRLVLMGMTGAMYGVAFYHTPHQLNEISRVLEFHTRINLFQVSPIYGFSGVTGLTAVGIAVPVFVWFATVGQTAFTLALQVGFFFFLGVPVFAAIFAFLWPLLGVHRLLGREKDGLLGANARMIESVGEALHHRVEAGELAGMADVSDTLTSLEIQRRLIQGTPTWPWSPGTPRAVAAGLLLPLIIWGIQRILERLLG